MNTTDIERMLRANPRSAVRFRGVHSMDSMVNEVVKENGEGFYVFNTKPRRSAGEHWMALATRRGRAYYFDSFGRHPRLYPRLASVLA